MYERKLTIILLVISLLYVGSPVYALIEFKITGNLTEEIIVLNETTNITVNKNLTSLDYLIVPGQNITKNFFFCTDENTTISNLFISPLIFQLNSSFSNQSFIGIQPSSCNEVNLTVYTEFTTLPNIYHTNMVLFTSEPANYVLPVDVVVEPLNASWRVEPSEENRTILKSEIGSIPLVVKSENNNITFKIDVDTNTTLIFTPRGQFDLLPFDNFSFPVYYFIPPNFTPGDYTSVITFRDNFNITRVTKISFRLLDTEPPKINDLKADIDFPLANEILTVSAKVSDDKGISFVNLSLNDGRHFEMRKKDDGTYFMPLIFNRSGIYTATVVVQDIIGNMAQESLNILIKPPSTIKNLPFINFYRFKVYENTTRVTLINETTKRPYNITIKTAFGQRKEKLIGLEQFTQLSVQLISIQGNVNISLTDERGNLIKLSDVGEAIYPNAIGNIYIQAIVEQKGRFFGKLMLNTSDDVTIQNNFVEFAGEGDNYYVSSPFGFKFPEVGEIGCEPQDTGFYNTSRQACISFYPIDYEPDRIAVITYKGALDAERTAYKTNLTVTTQQLNGASLWGGFYGITIFLTIISYGLWKWRLNSFRIRRPFR